MCTFGRSKMPTGSFFNSYLLALYGDCLISRQICSTLIRLLILAKRPRKDQQLSRKIIKAPVSNMTYVAENGVFFDENLDILEVHVI